MSISRVMRTFAAATLTTSMVFVGAPALAAKAPSKTTITAHLAPATVLVKSTAVVSGTVTPTGGTLTLQRLVGKSWVTLAHKSSTPSGGYAFAVRAPKAAATWVLRVSRTARKSTKAGISSRVQLRVVTTAYTIAALPAQATVTAPASVTVAGAVVPKVNGEVELQQLAGGAWSTVATASVNPSGTFTATAVLPVGPQRLRVLKAFTLKVAQGVSAEFDVTVQPVAAPPTITTAALPQARVAQRYFTALLATGGVGAYTWRATGLPPGLALSTTGALSGTPTTRGSATVLATVTDGLGHSSAASLALTIAPPQGYLVAWGLNPVGELGNGTMNDSTSPVPVASVGPVVAAAGGEAAGYALAADGSVWAWGDNSVGELGDGTLDGSTTPVQVSGLSNITAISARDAGALALRADGTVWSWGSNIYGEVGDGTVTSRLQPVQVPGLTSVVAIAAGAFTSYAVRSDGTVWSWGYNGHGELGNGNTTNSTTPVQVSTISRATAVAGGIEFGLALLADGTVSAWGDNSDGELGDGTTNSRTLPGPVLGLAGVTAVAAARTTTFALTSGGTEVAWGFGHEGQLGNGGTTSSSTPVAVHLSAVTGLGASSSSGYAVDADGIAWAWGNNSEGNLGDGTTTDEPEPVPVAGLSNVIRVDSGSTAAGGFAIVGF